MAGRGVWSRTGYGSRMSRWLVRCDPVPSHRRGSLCDVGGGLPAWTALPAPREDSVNFLKFASRNSWAASKARYRLFAEFGRRAWHLNNPAHAPGGLGGEVVMDIVSSPGFKPACFLD